jgi:hypothetical protein
MHAMHAKHYKRKGQSLYACAACKKNLIAPFNKTVINNNLLGCMQAFTAGQTGRY